MFDQGPHTVLRRDGVCLILKTPEREMPQVEYWGRDFGVDAEESALAALDAMTLKDTPPNKPDASWRPSLLPRRGPGARASKPTAAARRCSCVGHR